MSLIKQAGLHRSESNPELLALCLSIVKDAAAQGLMNTETKPKTRKVTSQ